MLVVAADSWPTWTQVWHALGRFHPAAVHFPIALILVACAAEFPRRTHGRPFPVRFAGVCATIGAFSAAAAAFLGWSSAATSGYTSGVGPHRWLGLSLAIVASLAAALAWSARPGGHRRFAFYRLALFCAGVLVVLAGHFGARLVHGATYLEDALALLRTTRDVPPREGTEGGTPMVVASSPRATLSYGQDILPILARRCFACHKGDDVEGELHLDTLEGLLAGGESAEPAIVPGDSSASRLIRLVTSADATERMPPKGKPLAPEEIALLRAWIDAGAQEDGSGAWHWAYRPVVRANPPPVTDTSWARNPIDHFVLARLEREGMTPSPEADRATLLRRLSLDLIGLPPTPEGVDAFVADTRADAYERAVDHLLDSPRYGERWARDWLDLARYADTHGYEKDDRRAMWAYRDWVIDALNRDLPFDRFTIEQIAGDMLPGATLRQILATGFHRNTQINLEGGTDPEEFRVEAVLDRVNTTASVWLGTTLACAQCHDHKYDALTQVDYFRFYAFFNQDEPDAVVVNDTGTEKQAAGPRVPAADWSRIGDLERAYAEAGALELEASRAAGKPDEGDARARLEAARGAIAALSVGDAMVMGKAVEPRRTRVFERGSFLAPGEPVEPGVPASLEAALPPPATPDRLGLARWLVDPANPLTPRVQANRLWARIFGRGLVETEDDFGVQGEPPTHPELLDYLASEFVRQGWSQKALLRAIVTSATYRQSSFVRREDLERDPDNRLLARAPRYRVEAEMVRDLALSASGLLSSKMFGPSVFPPQPPGIWTQIYSGDQWVESEGEDRHRRGLYTFWRRTSHYPTFAVFDAPSREIACARRPRTNTPLQALTTLNDPQFVEAAGALALRLMRAETSDAGRARLAFRLCVSREPEAGEIERLVALVEAQRAAYAADPASASELVAGARAEPGEHATVDVAAWIVGANVVLNLDETLTRG